MPQVRPNNIDRHLEWVLCEIQKYENYHNHKENMAWVATAFFVPSMITFGYFAAQTSSLFNILASLLVAVVTTLIYFFVNMQFRMRWLAADIQLGLMHFVADVCCSPITLPPSPKFSLDKEGRFPDHVWEYVEKVQKSKPRCVCQDLRDWFRCGDQHRSLDDRWRTELTSYVLVILSAIVAILTIWHKLILN